MRHPLIVVVLGLLISVSAVGCTADDSRETSDSIPEPTTTSVAATTVVPPTTTRRTDIASVAAGTAHIEMTYSGNRTSCVGDRTIFEGTVTVLFRNDGDAPLKLDVFGYESGSGALAEELAFLDEGGQGVPSSVLPAAGFFRVVSEIPAELEPGTTTWTMDLVPGTYIFDVSEGAALVDGLWRVAVIEVVPE